MSAQGLARYFKGVAAKRLTSVEVSKLASNQHEFQGVGGLRALLGDEPRTQKGGNPFVTRYVVMDDDAPPVSAIGQLSWYNARRNKVEQRSPEWHAYYSAEAEPLMDLVCPGDLAFFGLRADGTIAVIFARANSSTEQRLRWLFDLRDADLLQIGTVPNDRDLSLAQETVLEQLGIELEPEVAARTELALLMERFGERFPTSIEFSAYARASTEQKADHDPDAAIVDWFTTEERLFRTFERHQLSSQLDRLIQTQARDRLDVDAFMELAMSTIQRRKSRAGRALENHLEFIFRRHRLRFVRTGLTELKKRPDFLFPGEAEYRDPKFPEAQLMMLGVKTTGKDRWRQVINEADRIDEKHYFTLETAISEAQTAEMRAEKVQLVVPAPLLVTFTDKQREWIWPLGRFVAEVKRS